MIVVTDDWLIWVRAEFIYDVIYATGANLEFPCDLPKPVDPAEITGSEIVALIGRCCFTNAEVIQK